MRGMADVIVVGGGNAALCAAMAAAGGGARVVVLEAAAQNESGGNSWFTDGAMRCAFEDDAAVAALLGLSAADMARVVIPPYPAAAYFDDLQKAGGSSGRAPLHRVLAECSYETMVWLRDNEIPLELIFDNQAHEIDGVHHFFGNLIVRTVERGIGMIHAQKMRCEKLGVQMVYNARALELIVEDNKVVGVRADVEGTNSEWQIFSADAVVLACGGFEANEKLRAEHLGEAWAQARVRGTPHNLGDGLRMALAAGAQAAGNWAGCHAVGMDFNAPASGDTSKPGDIWKKHSYPYGLLFNKAGMRFVDEGANLRNYTYAQYGKAVLQQPDGVAYQIFDAQTEPLLRSEYRHEWAARYTADSLPALAAQLDINRDVFLAEINAYNDAVGAGEFNPAVLDGKQTRGLAINKSNWALRLDAPPYYAFPIICGITFTFGGVAVNESAAVLDSDDRAIAGLFAAGEMVGGLFGDSYPGGSGLMSGAVFGRIAGSFAAAQT